MLVKWAPDWHWGDKWLIHGKKHCKDNQCQRNYIYDLDMLTFIKTDITKWYNLVINEQCRLPGPIFCLSLIARSMGPTWGPSWASRTQVLAPWIIWVYVQNVLAKDLGQFCFSLSYSHTIRASSDSINTLRLRQDGQARIMQMTFSYWFFAMKMLTNWFKFRSDLFLGVQLTIIQYWFRWWLAPIRQQAII